MGNWLLFVVLAIAISCLGLFGLASIVAEQRTKEITYLTCYSSALRLLTQRYKIYAMKRLTILCFILLAALEISGQSKSRSAKKTVDRIKQLLHEHYIDEGKINRISDSLDVIRYDNLSQDEFVDRINNALQRSSKDKHLRLELNPKYAKKLLSNLNANEEQKSQESITNYGFTKMEILPDNIGYLRLAYLAEPTNLDDLIKSVYTFLKNTDNLIVDLRGNTGGSGAMVQKLASGFLMNDSSAILKVTYKNNTVRLKTESKPLFIYYNPVYLLCDGHTFSAGEGFALILQNRKRATLIGEPTAGAGNIAGPYAVDENFVITIPVGRIVDPVTGFGWEGTGVVPNVIVSPEDALQAALDIIQK